MLILFRMSNYSHLEQRPMKCITSLCSSVKDRHIPIVLSILQSTVKECEKNTHRKSEREKQLQQPLALEVMNSKLLFTIWYLMAFAGSMLVYSTVNECPLISAQVYSAHQSNGISRRQNVKPGADNDGRAKLSLSYQ